MAGRSESATAELTGGLGGAISLTELFPAAWVQLHTNAADIEEFLFGSEHPVDSVTSLDEVPDHEWNRYVQSNADFGSWSEMVSTAVEQYLARSADAETAAVDASDD
jgi:hypothetical protein